MEEKIPQGDLKLEKLSEKHKALLENFKTDNLELKKFLVEDALRNQEMGISDTYLYFHMHTGDLAAYITLLTDAVRVHGTDLGDSFLLKGVGYKSLPAMKIGRLCVGKEYVGRGIGTLAADFAMKKSLDIKDLVGVGCRFIFVEAKPETNAVHFYKKVGFEMLKKKEKGVIPMYFDLIEQIKIRRQKRASAQM